MSKATIISAQCPHCDADIEIPYYDDVNVEDHPELKEAILSGDFFKFVCPHCGEEISTVGPLLYHDPSVPSLIYMVPQGFDHSTEKLDEMLNMIESMEGDKASHYQARIVKTIDKLLEKIYIQDAGMDDHIVELVKLAYLKHYAKDLQSKGRIHATIFMPGDTAEDEAQIVFILGDAHELASVDFSKDYYAYFGTEYAEALKKENEAVHFSEVDEQWASNFVAQKN